MCARSAPRCEMVRCLWVFVDCLKSVFAVWGILLHRLLLLVLDSMHRNRPQAYGLRAITEAMGDGCPCFAARVVHVYAPIPHADAIQTARLEVVSANTRSCAAPGMQGGGEDGRVPRRRLTSSLPQG